MEVLKKFILGRALTNCYVINHNGKFVLIDAPPGIEKVASYLEENDIKLDEIYLTHTHYDHIVGLEFLVKNNFINPKNIYCPENEIFALKDPSRKGNLSAIIYDKPFSFNHKVSSLNDLKDDDIEIRYLSGHSLQSAVYIFNKDKKLFAGDVIFREDMQNKYFVLVPTISKEQFTKEIKEKVLTLPEDYLIYAGHYEDVTIFDRKEEARFK